MKFLKEVTNWYFSKRRFALLGSVVFGLSDSTIFRICR